MSVLAADDEQSAFLAKQKARLDSLSLKANTRSSELEANSSAAESSSTFLSAFNGTYQETITILAALPSKTITASERASTLATLTTATHTAFNLRALTASASLYLNAYDVRQCELKVDTLLKQIEGIKKTAVPREKFTFASRRGKMTPLPTHKIVSAERTVTTDTSDAAGDNIQYSIEHQNLSNTAVTQPAPRDGKYNHKDMRCKNITNCTLTLLDVYGCVRLQNLKNCTIYLGCVTGPLYVESVTKCKIFGASRQLRIHDTFETEFYMQTASGPIIENCKGLGFARDVIDYEGKDGVVESSKLLEIDGGKNQSQDVKDFKWLKKMQSPNWYKIDVEAGEGVDKSECKEVVRIVSVASKQREVREIELMNAAVGEANGGGAEEEESDDEL